MEHPRAQCDGCGGNLEPWEAGPVIFDCFHALHAACASGSDACPRCSAPGTRPPVVSGAAGAAAAASPPDDSSVAGSISSNGIGEPSAGVGEDSSSETLCEDCCGLYRPTETGYECPHCELRKLKDGIEDLQSMLGIGFGSPTLSWSNSTWSSSFGSPVRSPSPSDVDEFGQPRPQMAARAIPTAPSQYGGTVGDVDEFGQPKPPMAARAIPTAPSQYGGAVPPFGQQPPAPANTFHPPVQLAPPPSVFQRYPHPDLFRPPPYFYGPPLPPPQQQQHYHFQTSTFDYQPPPRPPPPAPACFTYAPPPPPPPYCAACGGAVIRGQTAVTSQCNHTFHFRCFAGGAYACPACGAQWSDMGPAIPPPSYRY